MSRTRSSQSRVTRQPWRLGALIAGVLSLLLASYIFYFWPWLGASTPIDAWLDRQGCLLERLCAENSVLPHQFGLLAVGLSLLLFVYALWSRDDAWRRSGAVTPWRTVWMAILASLGLASVGYQVFRVLVDRTAPAPAIWLIGILAFGVAALLWDAPRTVVLAQTLAGIGVAAGMAAVLIGAGVAFSDPVTSLWFLIPGLLTTVAASLWSDRVGGALDRVDHLLMAGLGLLALILGEVRIDSWRYAFIGDEWGFYDLATTLIHRPAQHTLFAVVDANAYHTVFSSTLQAWIMQAAGETVHGWRLASLLPLVLSVPATYVFVRWLSGRTGAIVAAGLLAASHMLLSFSMVAYNNTQALLPLTVGLGLFAFAQRRDSALRFYLLGATLGSAFLLFGLARLVLLPIGILVLFFCWTSWRRVALSTVAIGVGIVAVAAPLLFHLDNWRGLLNATPAARGDLESGAPIGGQMAGNALSGALAFLANERNTHFVAGPHVDPLTAVLVIIGLAATLVAWRRRRAVAWLAASLTFWLAVSVLQQYAWVSTTRMFVLVPIYAIYGGLGAATLARIFLADRPRLRTILAGLTVLLVILANQIHIERFAHAQSRVPAATLLVREFQQSAAPDGSGIPVYIVWDDPDTQREAMILRGYDVEQSRIRFITAAEALELAELCVDERPQMLLVHADASMLDAIDAHLRRCWPVHEAKELVDEAGDVRLRRYMTLAGLQEVVLPRRSKVGRRQEPDRLHVPDPGDLVVDGAGQVFILDKETPAVRHYDAEGRLVDEWPLATSKPSALAVTPDGLLLVADSGPQSALVWYDADGRVLQRLSTNGALGVPAGLAVGSDGDIYVADAALRQVARLDADGGVQLVYTGGGQVQMPISVAISGEDALWVLDGADGEWRKLSVDDEVLASVPAGPTSVDNPARLVEAADGSILFTQPDRRRVVQMDGDGRLLDVWSGFQNPSSMAVDGQGRLYVVDHELNRLLILPPTGINFDVNGTQVRAEPPSTSDETDSAPAGTLFLSPLSPLPLANEAGVVDNGAQRYLTSAQIGGLSRPRAVAAGIDPATQVARIYVGDAVGGGLAVLSATGDFVRLAESSSPALQEVADIAVDARGFVYVLDSAAGYVHRYEPDGTYGGLVAGGDGHYEDARGLHVDGHGDIWIAGTRSGQLARLDGNGRVLARTAVLPGQGSQPVDLLVDGEGNLYVVEARSARLLHLSPAGDLLSAWSLAPFNSVDASHLAMDGQGAIYVTQPEQGVVLSLTPGDRASRSWHIAGAGGRSARPVGLAVDAAGTIWTTDVNGGGLVAADVAD